MVTGSMETRNRPFLGWAWTPAHLLRHCLLWPQHPQSLPGRGWDRSAKQGGSSRQGSFLGSRNLQGQAFVELSTQGCIPVCFQPGQCDSLLPLGLLLPGLFSTFLPGLHLLSQRMAHSGAGLWIELR